MKPNLKSLRRSLLAATLVIGQTMTVPSLAVLAADSSVRLAGQVVVSDLASAGGFTSEKRAEQVQQNLDNALVASSDKTPTAIGITYVSGMPVITLGGYNVVTVDTASAKALSTSPALLAQKWANALRNSLKDQASIKAYVSQLTGDFQTNAPSVTSQAPFPEPQNYQSGPQYSSSPAVFQAQSQDQPAYRQARVVYAPAGLVIPATLRTSISSNVARAGDIIQAEVSQAIILGDSQIPVGTTLIGQVSDADAGKFLGRTGSMSITFTRLRTPDGQETPISAHILGGVDKYEPIDDQSASFKGETWKGKAVQAGVRGLVGAGTGAALGTAVGAIAGGARGAGKGAWSGTAIGAGVGVAQSLLLRKGSNVTIASGTPIKLQLDSALQLTSSPSTTLNAPIAYGSYYQ
ncbi:MAG: hypothetical protein K8F91_15560 [Candidatus Obscuribacterales bacterium]|nr:hypothetical protein [Candidatus Obscuribacterales bacterium]